jgi:hypothetical protein
MSLEKSGEAGFTLNQYWALEQGIQGNTFFDFNPQSKLTYKPTFNIITFNDKKVPNAVTFLSGYG